MSSVASNGSPGLFAQCQRHKQDPPLPNHVPQYLSSGRDPLHDDHFLQPGKQSKW